MLDRNALFYLVGAEIIILLAVMVIFRKNSYEKRKMLSYTGMALAIVNFVLLMASKFLD
jgi:hypothetical protein